MTIRDKAKQLKGLKQYQNYSKTELYDLAKRLLEEEKAKYTLGGNWLDKEEETKANERFQSYLNSHSFTDISDIELLRKVVYLEILADRIEKNINSTYGADKAVQKWQTDAYNNALNQSINLKKKLGILGDKGKVNPLEYLFKLFKKFKIWLAENSEGREVDCCFCGKKLFLKIRTDKYEPIPHPYVKKVKIRGAIIANNELWEAFKSQKPLTREKMAKILEVSPLYIDWLEKEIYGNEEQT